MVNKAGNAVVTEDETESEDEGGVYTGNGIFSALSAGLRGRYALVPVHEFVAYFNSGDADLTENDLDLRWIELNLLDVGYTFKGIGQYYYLIPLASIFNGVQVDINQFKP